MIFKNNLKQFYCVIGLVFLFLIISPTIILADTIGGYACPECDALVCCGNEGGTPCTFNDMFCLVKKIIDFILFQIVPPLAVLWFAYAGFTIVTAGGNPSKVKAGRDMITYAFLGLVLVYAAWALVFWFVSFIGGESSGNWLLQFFESP